MTWVLAVAAKPGQRPRYFGPRSLPVDLATEAMPFDSKDEADLAIASMRDSGFAHLLTPEEIVVRPVYESFDAYVAAYPAGEAFRRWLTDDGRRPDVLLLPAEPDRGGLPGDYYWATVGRWTIDKLLQARLATGRKPAWYDTPWYVRVNDCDDSCSRKHFATEDEARAELRNLTQLVPFAIYDLRAFGYSPE